MVLGYGGKGLGIDLGREASTLWSYRILCSGGWFFFIGSSRSQDMTPNRHLDQIVGSTPLSQQSHALALDTRPTRNRGPDRR